MGWVVEGETELNADVFVGVVVEAQDFSVGEEEVGAAVEAAGESNARKLQPCDLPG